MSEEKKAIEYLKNDLEMTKQMGKKWGFQEKIKNEEIILNLIEKQQKAIKELMAICDYYRNAGDHITENFLESIKPNYISKDKIRELLEKYDKDIAWTNADDHYYFVKYINELLEENNEKSNTL